MAGKCLNGKLRFVVNWLCVSQRCYHIDSTFLVCWEGMDVLHTIARQVSLVRHRWCCIVFGVFQTLSQNQDLSIGDQLTPQRVTAIT